MNTEQNSTSSAPDNETYLCADCGAEFENHDYLDSVFCDGVERFVCRDCRDYNYTECYECEKYYHNDELRNAINSRGHAVTVCESCRNDDYDRCDDCGDYCHNNMIYCDGNTVLCSACFDSDYFRCDQCEAIYRNEDCHSIDDSYYCPNCADGIDGQSNLIADYHSHKNRSPKYYYLNEESRNKRRDYAGFELEIECTNYTPGDVAEQLVEYSDDQELFYFEHDGSLKNGLEIISAPMTLGYLHKTAVIEDICGVLSKLHCKSHNTTTCGLHVHINRRNMPSSEQIKLGVFFVLNAHLLEIFGRRDYNSYCKSDSLMQKKRAEIPYPTGSHDRYDAINYVNGRTIEFRFFRGTIKPETIRATIELCFALKSFVKTISFPQLTPDGQPWKMFCRWLMDNHKLYPNCIKYMEYKSIFKIS